MKKISCLIVEDDILARKSIERLCEKSEVLQVIDSVENAEEAQIIIEKDKIDLVFLDIEMQGMSGIELLDTLPYLPQIIFTTANKDYAYEAYEYDVTDFLVKPITLLRFQKAIEKTIERNNRLNNIATISALNEIYIKSDKKYIRVAYEDILYFENIGDYVKVITTSGSHILYGSLKSIAEKIKHPRFLRVHRSYIINMSKIKDIEDNSLIINKKIIPISRAHKSTLMESLNIL